MGKAARIGITGGIGSGKSTVASRFAEHGAAVIDSDAIARELTGAGGAAIAALRAAFGDAAIDAQGAMDRGAMRARVLADPAERKRLEAILHPLVRARCIELAAHHETRYPLVVLDVPLLAEAEDVRRALALDRILVVDCAPERQLALALARAAMPAGQIRALMAAQATRGARLDLADDVIVNAGSRDALWHRVDRLWSHYCPAEPL
jgi:dephospho-CoA kinase